MKRRTRRHLVGIKPGYHAVPEVMDSDYGRKPLTKISILECENGGKVITVEQTDSARSSNYLVYQVRPEDNLMDILATVLVEARLK